MKTRVIVSTTEKKVSPWLSFLLSLVLPGLGEIYTGTPLSGIIFALSRITAILALPFYSYINSSESMAGAVFTVIILFVVITLLSAIHAAFKSRKRMARLLWYNSAAFYSVFIFINVLFTAVALLLFISFFGIKKVQEETPPLFRKGDLIAVKKLNPTGYSRGDIVEVQTVTGGKLLRVIGIPGEKISYSRGRFLSDSSELPLSIFTEEELGKFSLTDYDVVSEQNSNVLYPVKNSTPAETQEVLLTADEYYLAPDTRTSPEYFRKAAKREIRGRVEGILLSGEGGLLPGRLSLPAENIITGK